LDKAVTTGQLSATHRIILVQEKSDQYGFLVFSPVYQDGVLPATAPQRIFRLKGLLLGVFKVGDIVDGLDHDVISKIDLTLFDDSAASGEHLLYPKNSHINTADELPAGYRLTRKLDIAGITWSVVATPKAGAFRANRDASTTTLLLGLLISALWTFNLRQKSIQQRALRDQQFYTRSLIESNIDALMTTDPSGIITDVNQQMELLIACPRDELIGTPFKNYFTDPERAEAGIKRVLIEKKVTDYELTARAKDGQETEVSYNASNFYDRDGLLQGVFAAARDVTERNRLDRVLQEKNVELESATAVAEQASQAKSEFLSSMSHELRTPLNAILGFAQLLESDTPPPTPVQKDGLTEILHSGWHLLALINEVLDLSKIESGHAPLSQEPVSLAEILFECQKMIGPQAQQRGITVTFPLLDKSIYIRADRTRVKQVLINLLSNAIKYNIKLGTVEVTCSEVTTGSIRVSIRDTGTGLSPQHLTQLFQAFNRLGQEAGGEEGTGIGLVLAKRLVELMGGVIGVESTLGVGSVFWFELLSVDEPRLSEAEVNAAALIKPHARLKTLVHTLLYVEDNPANLNLVKQIIARHPDMRLLSAVDGSSGIEIARASQPDVILMDINMSGMNGYEALEILKSDPTTAHIPVLALTANAMPHDIRKGMEAGFFRYITKPIMVNEFMEALNVAMEFAEQ
jgi:PAS domain S-box-containing protein